MAFTPTPPPPSPQHLAQIAEALCARAEARQRATKAAALRQSLLWKKELSALRSTAPVPTTPVRPTGAAAVLEARLARICAPLKLDIQPSEPAQYSSLEHVQRYKQRMERYYTPLSTIAPTPAPRPTKPAKPAPTPPPAPQQPPPPSRPSRIMEPALAASPTRVAIPPTPVKPMLTGAHASLKVTLKPPVEEVKRPNLVKYIVTAVMNFVEGIKKKTPEEHKSDKEADVAFGAATVQAIAVLMSLGK